MLATAKTLWIYVVFGLAIAGLLVAGMRGFTGYFPWFAAVAGLYLVFFYVRAFRKKRRGR